MSDITFIRKPSILIFSQKIKEETFSENRFKEVVFSKHFTDTESRVFNAIVHYAFLQMNIGGDIKNGFDITFWELRKLYPSFESRTNIELQNAVYAVLNTSINFVESYVKNYPSKFTKDGYLYEYSSINIISRIDWRIDKSGFRIYLNSFFQEDILCAEPFAKLDINEMNTLSRRSPYLMSLYEIVQDYRNVYSTPVFSIEELTKFLGVPYSEKFNFNIFKRDVLNGIIKELQNKMNLDIILITKKSGKKIVSIRFEFKKSNTKAGASVSDAFYSIKDESVRAAIVSLSKGKHPNYKDTLAKGYMEGCELTIDNVASEKIKLRIKQDMKQKRAENSPSHIKSFDMMIEFMHNDQLSRLS